MSTVTVFTAARMQEIEDTTVVSGLVDVNGHLLLSTREGTAIDAGNIMGPMGPGFTYRGVWAANTDYAVREVVTSGGSTFVVNVAHKSGTTAPTPTDPGVNLSLWAQKGDQGIDGVQGSAASPAGTIALWGSDVAPSNWMICDGSAISRTTYASLFAIIGTKYGAGDGVNTFNLPNLKGRTPVGKDAAQTEFAALAQIGGEKAHLLTTAEMPSHQHTFNTEASATASGFTGTTGAVRPTATGYTQVQSVSATGGGAAHNILQPYSVVNFIIKVTNGDTPGDSQLTQRVSNLESFASNAAAGTITIFGGDTPPTNWKLCDGSAISRTTYASLFAAIGTKYGAGDGSTTFNLPNFKGKVPAGLDATQTEFNALGKTGGEKTHILTVAEMPSHTHGITRAGFTQVVIADGTDGATGANRWHTADGGAPNDPMIASATGGGGAHNVLQPYLTVNYIIKFTNGDTQGDSQLTTRVSTLEAGNTYSVRSDRKTARLQSALSGGGVRKAGLTGISWTERFIAMGGGQDDLAPSGYFDIEMPPNGTVIPVFSKALANPASVTVANGTIPMSNWQALYYNLPLGSAFPSQSSRFMLVDFQSVATSDIPASAILIAIRNGDSYAPRYTWGDGQKQDHWRTFGAMQGGWLAYGTGYQTPAYRYSDNGEIVLKGLIRSGAGTFITFPAVLAPEEQIIWTVDCSTGVARIDLDTVGNMFVQGYKAGGTNGYVSLQGVRWFPKME